FVTFTFEQSKKAFLKVQVSGHFSITEEAFNEFCKEDKIIFPKGFMCHLTIIVVSSARCVLHAKTEGSNFNKFLLPTIDVTKIVSDDIEFHLSEKHLIMTKKPEHILENNLIEQLADLGYKKVILKDEKELLTNLKAQLEKHNKTKLSDAEFAQVTNHLSKGNVFEKAKTLRDKVQYTKDNGETGYLEFINQIHW